MSHYYPNNNPSPRKPDPPGPDPSYYDDPYPYGPDYPEPGPHGRHGESYREDWNPRRSEPPNANHYGYPNPGGYQDNRQPPKRPRRGLRSFFKVILLLFIIGPLLLLGIVVAALTLSPGTPQAPGDRSTLPATAPTQPESYQAAAPDDSTAPEVALPQLPLNGLPLPQLDLSADSLPTLDPNTPEAIRSSVRTEAVKRYIPSITTTDPAQLNASSAAVCDTLDDGKGGLVSGFLRSDTPTESTADKARFIGISVATECPQHAPMVNTWWNLYQVVS